MAEFALALREFFDEANAKADVVVIKSVVETMSRIKIRTPVDTGRLRANWQYGLDAAPAGQLALGSAGAQVGFTGAGMGHVHFVVNNLPYANRQEFGFSGTDALGRSYDQPGRAMVGLTVLEWPDIVRSAAASTQ